MLLLDMPPPEEGILHRECSTQAYINQRSLGTGTLYVAESQVSWVKDADNGGFSLQYPHICVHAISRDSTHFTNPCVLLMIDVNLDLQTGENGLNDSDSEDGGDEGNDMSEVRFVPPNESSLDCIYKAISDGQVLQPPDADDMDSDEGGFFQDEEEEGEYDVQENGHHHPPGAYEDNMEDDLEDHTVGGLASSRNDDDDDEAMETGQFDDADGDV